MIEATVAIDDAHALTFEMRKIVERIENPMPQPPLPRRRAHAIEEQRILPLRRCHIVIMVPRINLQPRHASFIQLLKQRSEPVLMLVINGDGLFEPKPVPIGFHTHQTSRVPFESLSSHSKSAARPTRVLLTRRALEFQCHMDFVHVLLADLERPWFGSKHAKPHLRIEMPRRFLRYGYHQSNAAYSR